MREPAHVAAGRVRFPFRPGRSSLFSGSLYVILLALLFAALPGFAGVIGSPHDFSQTPPATPEDVQLLREIRDSLKK